MKRAAGNGRIGRRRKAHEGKKSSQARIVELTLQSIEMIGAEPDVRMNRTSDREGVLHPDRSLLIPVEQLWFDEWKGRPDRENAILAVCVVFKE